METEQFIAEIERRPGIYDSNCPQYQDRVAKWALWCEVCEVMTPRWSHFDEHRRQQRVKELQKRWKSLRDSFMKELKVQRELQRTGQSANRKKYIFFDQMLFLLPCLESRYSIRGCKDDVEESETDSAKIDREPNEGDFGMEGQLEPEDYSTHLPRHLANCFPERKYRDIKRKRYIDEEEEESDADRMFLLSLLPTMRKLRGYHKSVIRIEIAQILHKALYEPDLAMTPVVSFTEGQEGFHHLMQMPYEKSPASASSTMSCDENNPSKVAKGCKCGSVTQCKCKSGSPVVNGSAGEKISPNGVSGGLQVNGDSKHSADSGDS